MMISNPSHLVLDSSPEFRPALDIVATNHVLISSLAFATYNLNTLNSPTQLLLYAYIMKDKREPGYGIRIDYLALLNRKPLLNGKRDYFQLDGAVAGSRKVDIKGITLILVFKKNQRLDLVVLNGPEPIS